VLIAVSRASVQKIFTAFINLSSNAVVRFVGLHCVATNCRTEIGNGKVEMKGIESLAH
jgi:hypothetical protein